jgi:alkylation response protein AidB-like acyl-CoA dehydrogenase
MTQSPYQAPLQDMRFVIAGLGGYAALAKSFEAAGFNNALLDDVLVEAARFAERELAPIYHETDRLGVELVGGQVKIPAPVRSAYAEFVAAGWPSLAGPVAYGGQGLPNFVSVPVTEMWHSANLAFALAPLLTNAAVEALAEHGSETLKAQYLERLVSGEWTGTMNLTEPQAGSDLGLVQAVAVPENGAYRLKGRKIFITWGDHDLTDNIVHFVLARMPDAPPGVKGLSLFLVPKFLPEGDSLGPANDIVTVSLERKLGIHGSPTCVLSYGENGGALAHLVGERNAGLACMFTMMNQARLAVGVEGLGIAERAYQKAVAYARERRQGHIPEHPSPVAIIRHADVRRMLMSMKAFIQAMRSIAYWGALNIDLAAVDGSERHTARAAFLTPLIKAWCTETAQEVVTLGLQIHGGVGYIEETGAAQLLRDVRITTIYEGTTGIQAADFARRRIAADGGETGRAIVGELRTQLAADVAGAGLSERVHTRLAAALTAAERVLDAVVAEYAAEPQQAGSMAVPALMCFGTLLGGALLVHNVAVAARSVSASSGEREYSAGQAMLAEFYVAQLLPRAQALAEVVFAGGASSAALPEALF